MTWNTPFQKRVKTELVQGDAVGEAGYVVDRIGEFGGIVVEVEGDGGEKGQGEHGGLILADRRDEREDAAKGLEFKEARKQFDNA